MSGDIEDEFKRWRIAHLTLNCPDKDHDHCAFMCGFELGIGNDNWVERLLPNDETGQLPLEGENNGLS